MLHIQFGVLCDPGGSVLSLHVSEEVLLASCINFDIVQFINFSFYKEKLLFWVLRTLCIYYGHNIFLLCFLLDIFSVALTN